MSAVEGVDWATAAMATPANLETLAEQGFDGDELAGAGRGRPRARRPGGRRRRGGSGRGGRAGRDVRRPRRRTRRRRRRGRPISLRRRARAARRHRRGDLGARRLRRARDAQGAVARACTCLLFSDNVPVDDEVELKERAARPRPARHGTWRRHRDARRHLPGLRQRAATRRRPGRPSSPRPGTGAQEATALLDRWGVGVSHVIGVGGRDLTDGRRRPDGPVAALRALRRRRGDRGDPAGVQAAGAATSRDACWPSPGDTPAVAALIGLPGRRDPDGVTVADTLESGVVATLDRLGRPPPD